jgi:hypothetical protein
MENRNRSFALLIHAKAGANGGRVRALVDEVRDDDLGG